MKSIVTSGGGTGFSRREDGLHYAGGRISFDNILSKSEDAYFDGKPVSHCTRCLSKGVLALHRRHP